ARGPADEELTIDTAVSPAPASAPVLVVSSGVHGVEGFFGSAVQLAALDAWAKTGAPTGVRCVFIHAVCPSRFARLRPLDEANTDLNRHFPLDRHDDPRRPPAH